MSAAGDAPPPQGKAELRIVGTSVSHEIDALFDRVAASLGRRAPRVLQVGSRTLISDRNVLKWRSLVAKRFGGRGRFVGIDLEEGANVDRVLDICGSAAALKADLGDGGFDLVVCCHVLEHTSDPWRAARNMEGLLKPGGHVFVSAAWSQAFHATPDDLWRFSVRRIILPLSLIRDWYVPKGLSDRRKWKPETRRHTDPANTAVLIEHSGQTGVKKWTRGRTILPVPVASLSHFRPLIGAFCSLRRAARRHNSGH